MYNVSSANLLRLKYSSKGSYNLENVYVQWQYNLLQGNLKVGAII